MNRENLFKRRVKEQTKPKVEKHYCAKCRKCLTSEDGTTISALLFSFQIINPPTKGGTDFMRLQLGRFAPPDMSKDLFLEICYECFLGAFLGGK